MNFSATKLSWTSIHDFLALPLCQDKEVAYSQLSKLSIYNEKFLYQTSCSSKSADVAYDQYPSLCLWQQEISRTELTILLKLILNITSYCNRVKRPIILPAWTSRKKFIYPQVIRALVMKEVKEAISTILILIFYLAPSDYAAVYNAKNASSEVKVKWSVSNNGLAVVNLVISVRTRILCLFFI